MRQVVSVHDTHVVNTVCPLLLKIIDQQVALLFRDLLRLHFSVVGGSTCPGSHSLHPLHGATWIDEGVVAHMGGGEGFA